MSQFTRILEIKKNIKKKIPFSLAFVWEERWFRIMLLVALLFLGFVYLWLTTTTAQRGFTLDNLRKQEQGLKKQHVLLEREMVEYQSMPYLKELAEKHNMQTQGHIEFITGSGAVALTR